jgi:hypothetical protein
VSSHQYVASATQSSTNSILFIEDHNLFDAIVQECIAEAEDVACVRALEHAAKELLSPTFLTITCDGHVLEGAADTIRKAAATIWYCYQRALQEQERAQ